MATRSPKAPASKPMILSDQQAEVLSKSPARLEIIDALSVIGPCSIAELARELGRTARSLYYHIDMLREAGLVIQTGTQHTGRREEALYAIPKGGFRMKTSPAGVRHGITYNATVLKLAERNFREAVENNWERDFPDGTSTVYTRRQRAWLSDKAIQEIFQHLASISRIMSAGKQKKQGQVYSFTTVLAPLSDARRDSD